MQYSLFRPTAEETGWQLGGGLHWRYFSLLGWSAAGAAVHSPWCCFGTRSALLPGGSCWQIQLWLCVFAASGCPFQLPLYNQWPPTPVPSPPGSLLLLPEIEVYMSMCACTQSSLFAGPIRLASTDVTGLQEFQECGGAGAGVSILGSEQKGRSYLSIGRQLSSAGWLPDRLVGYYDECCGPTGDGLRYFYGNCKNQGLLEAKYKTSFSCHYASGKLLNFLNIQSALCLSCMCLRKHILTNFVSIIFRQQV